MLKIFIVARSATSVSAAFAEARVQVRPTLTSISSVRGRNRPRNVRMPRQRVHQVISKLCRAG
jgi:hypothetical protein